jgi:hypothetical protein
VISLEYFSDALHEKCGGWKVFTIWGIESDAAERERIEERFKAGLQRLSGQKKKPRR